MQRNMPVDAEGHAVAPTVIVYASGLAELVAYYATCPLCSLRYPFYSPPERDAWAEAHRVDNLTHPVELTVEQWNFMRPPWVAADGQPLDPSRSPDMTFPLPDYDARALAVIEERRAHLRAGCPRHPDLPADKRVLTFSKELLVGAGADQMHLVGSFQYADRCFVTTELDLAEGLLRYAD